MSFICRMISTLLDMGFWLVYLIFENTRVGLSLCHFSGVVCSRAVSTCENHGVEMGKGLKERLGCSILSLGSNV